METIPHNRLTFGPEEEQAVARVVRSGRWAAGSVLVELEARMAREAGVAFAVGVSSGVSALRLSLLALGVGPGDVVAVPAYSCVALANAVLACGAAPVPVDVDPHTWNLSVAGLRAAIAQQPKLRAAIAVHSFGAVAPVRDLEALGLPVIEDCSHAFGRAPLGRLGRVAMLSLYATKLLGAGEGGMILTDDAGLADFARRSRDYADQGPSTMRLNDKMTDLEAALALCQLDRLPQTLARREALAARYTQALAGVEGELPVNQDSRVWYRYAFAARDDAGEVVARLADRGIAAARPVEDWSASALPVSTRAFQQLVSLPLYPTLTSDEQDRVIAAVQAAIPFPLSA